MSTKDAVDNNVRALKKLQIQSGLVIIVISSLNRQNYLAPIDFESFKESGGIEYTADVVWGLQLSIMNDTDFTNTKSLTEKRMKVRDAKARHPRDVELVCLKNRYGISSYTCNFKYYAMFDYFEPSVQPASSGLIEQPASTRSNMRPPTLEEIGRIDVFDQLSGRKATFGK